MKKCYATENVFGYPLDFSCTNFDVDPVGGVNDLHTSCGLAMSSRRICSLHYPVFYDEFEVFVREVIKENEQNGDKVQMQ